MGLWSVEHVTRPGRTHSKECTCLWRDAKYTLNSRQKPKLWVRDSTKFWSAAFHTPIRDGEISIFPFFATIASLYSVIVKMHSHTRSLQLLESVKSYGLGSRWHMSWQLYGHASILAYDESCYYIAVITILLLSLMAAFVFLIVFFPVRVVRDLAV